VDARIEDYLDHMGAPLVGMAPYARRQSLRAEWRAHLEMLAAAYEELGSDRDAAVTQALKQFGDPNRLGRLWARTWRSGAPAPRRRPVLPAMRAAFGWFSLATIASYPILLAGLRAENMEALDSLGMPFCAIGMPLLAGVLSGLLARGRHGMGAFYALALLIPTTLAAVRVLSPGVSGAEAGLTFLQFLFWMPLGCAAATLGGWLREHLTWSSGPWVVE
jgi:hypothetical protein